MNRRTLLVNGSKLVSLASFYPILSCTMNSPDQLNFEEISIRKIQKSLISGEYDIVTLVEYYLERIRTLDRSGPALNSILWINPDAISIATALDEKRKRGDTPGVLHGIPVILKDNIDTGDKMPTTAGSRALDGSFAKDDSHLVKSLRNAEAVIIAKANLSEWANFRADFSSSGWSGLGGQTKNPYILSRNPCGSSAGSAVAVSANLCVLAIGTETNGSIVCPSNANGIVGIKPTVGLISRDGIIPISSTQDSAGPMARTIEDAVICLGALTQSDPTDTATNAEGRVASNDYSSYLKPDGLKSKKIGILNASRDFHHRVSHLFDQSLEMIKKEGAELVEINKISELPTGGDSFTVMLYEFKDGLNNYFNSLGPDSMIKSIDDVIEFNKKDSIELKYFDQDLLELAAEKGSLEEDEYLEARSRLLENTRENGIDKVMDEHQLDLIIAPTGSPAWKTDLINGDRFLGGSSSPAAQAGYPSITCPMGFIDGLPVGISFFGRAWSEGILIEAAYAFEQITKVRKAPQFIKD